MKIGVGNSYIKHQSNPASPNAAQKTEASVSADAQEKAISPSFSSTSDSASLDMAKIEAIRDAIKNGSLQIDAEKIADALIQTTQDFLSES